MSDDVKVQKVNFSLPYRAGMETKPGYVSTVDSTSKTFPGEFAFAKFSFDLDNTIEVKQAEALEVGARVLRQNKQRTNLIGTYAKEFGIVAPAAGGLTKTDKALIAAMGELTSDNKKIAAAFKKRTGKDITTDEIAAILA